ncbi:hypothetical protein Pst134EB_027568 [Puccinia striiformis f. sp. tritici]|nr:hypothetical protein Pst134EB_027568 [Puccinia striiformis f. sp. tritici]
MHEVYSDGSSSPPHQPPTLSIPTSSSLNVAPLTSSHPSASWTSTQAPLPLPDAPVAPLPATQDPTPTAGAPSSPTQATSLKIESSQSAYLVFFWPLPSPSETARVFARSSNLSTAKFDLTNLPATELDTSLPRAAPAPTSSVWSVKRKSKFDKLNVPNSEGCFTRSKQKQEAKALDEPDSR